MFKVCATRCDQCLFSDQRIVSKKRMAEIIKDCRKKDSYFICHKHEEAMCRGYYETQSAPQMLRIANRLQMVTFIQHENVVTPLNGDEDDNLDNR